MFKGILLIILIVGIILIFIEYIRTSQKCPLQKTIYKYLPETYNQDQRQPVSVDAIFRTMFTQPSTWIDNVNELNKIKINEINKYFISQE